jgi:hypothetical protein
VAYVLKARTVEPEKQLLLVNGSANTPTAWQWFSSCHLTTARDTYTTIEEWLKVVFSARSMPRLCKKDQLLLRDGPETAVRRLGGWCEMAASLQEHKPGCRGLSLFEDVTKKYSEDRD